MSYIAVKTTGIVCRPGCSAKAPLPENITRIETLQDSYAMGFRPCKVCTPEFEFIDNILKQTSKSVELRPPRLFSFQQTIDFMSEFDRELLFRVESNSIRRLFCIGEKKVLASIDYVEKKIRIRFNITLKKQERLNIVSQIWTWLDLSRNMSKFYSFAKKDPVLKPLITQFRGLRMIRIPDLFEALCWAIIGQQVNLTFAFEVKGRFIKRYGHSQTIDGTRFYIFPSPQNIVELSIAELKEIQLSQRKAEYILEVAKQLASAELVVDELKLQNYEAVFERLTSIRGIGPWTADYVLMKTFGYTKAYPVGDAGLQNAVKKILGHKEKPTEKKLRSMAKKWPGWEAYATFYLWRYLSA